MPSQEDIAAQQELLTTHRETLHYLLKQRAQFSVFVPPHVLAGIRDARENILHSKEILRKWGISVEDLPNDYDDSPMAGRQEDKNDALLLKRRQKRLAGMIAIVLTVAALLWLSFVVGRSGDIPPEPRSNSTAILGLTTPETTSPPEADPYAVAATSMPISITPPATPVQNTPNNIDIDLNVSSNKFQYDTWEAKIYPDRGGYILETRAITDSNIEIKYDVPHLISFEYQVEMTLISSTDDDIYYGLDFGATGSNAIQFLTNKRGLAVLRTWNAESREWHRFIDDHKVQHINLNGSNTLKVIVKGDNMQVYVNDELVGEAIYKNIPMGRVGIALDLNAGRSASIRISNYHLKRVS